MHCGSGASADHFHQGVFQFHPLAIEDCRNFNQRAKVASYGDYLFLSLTTTARENDGLRSQEMEAFLGHDYLITVHREPLAAIDSARAHLGANSSAPVHPDFILYLITDHLVDVYFPLLDEMDDEIDALEDQILENATQETMQRIFLLKQQLVALQVRLHVACPFGGVGHLFVHDPHMSFVLTNALHAASYGVIPVRCRLPLLS